VIRDDPLVWDGYKRRVVCFTCGNAAAALRDAGLDVLEIGPAGDLVPGRWWEVDEIAREFPDRFDATAGHLPLPMVAKLAEALGEYCHAWGIEPQDGDRIPTGSGETLLAMTLAYPGVRFVAEVNGGPETEFTAAAPLYGLVSRHFRVVQAAGPFRALSPRCAG
jgi:hypothetical protein